MAHNQEIIIDAAARFVERQKEAQQQALIMELPEELRWVGRCISEQPARFFGYLKSCSEQVADALQTDFGSSMQAALAVEDADDEDANHSGVYNRSNPDGTEGPCLFVTDRDVASMGRLLEPMLAQFGPEQSAKSIEVATAAVCWMNLGAWAFDRLDPRRNGEVDESPEAYAFWAELMDLSLDDDMNDPLVQGRVKQEAEVLKWRIAGTSAYKGMVQTDLVHDLEVRAFQRMSFGPAFAQQVETDPSHIRPEHYALANPLDNDALRQLLGRLGQTQ